MNIENEIFKVEKTLRPMNYLIGKENKFILIEPNNIVKKTNHKDTIYWHFKAEIKSIDDKELVNPPHTIQIPAKTLGRELYYKIKKANMTTFNKIDLHIVKLGNRKYNINIIKHY